MKAVRYYSQSTLNHFINKRNGEQKFGEGLTLLSDSNSLKHCKEPYVLVGIPEDIGVRANFGRSGTERAWEQALKMLCNLQANTALNPDRIALLGEVDCDAEMVAAQSITNETPDAQKELGRLVEQIDIKVSGVITEIVKSGKVPVVIGGGHNNSYGNLKGASEAKGKKLHAINLDPHADMRPLEHRHSGNGFSYAIKEGYLDKYFILGLQHQYNAAEMLKMIEKQTDRFGCTFQKSLLFNSQTTLYKSFEKAEAFCCHGSFGLELDLDAIAMMGSSAMSPTGFTLEEARQYIRYFSRHPNCTYIHICEGSPSLEVFPNQVGKAIAYLISDILDA